MQYFTGVLGAQGQRITICFDHEYTEKEEPLKEEESVELRSETSSVSWEVLPSGKTLDVMINSIGPEVIVHKAVNEQRNC